MDNTINIMATGLKYRTQSISMTANNIANVESVGYKHSELTAAEFSNYLMNRIDENGLTEIGAANRGVTANAVITDESQGNVYSTGSYLDFALDGEGSFTLTGAGGGQILSRDGRFRKDENGYLTDSDGNFVMGENGRIYVGNRYMWVSPNGGVWIGGYYADRLRITADGDFTGKVMQGYLERSNVNITNEMAAMIEDSRAFQSYSQIVRSADKILEKTVTEIGRV
jgi:flagellar basal-body rod protein FlgF